MHAHTGRRSVAFGAAVLKACLGRDALNPGPGKAVETEAADTIKFELVIQDLEL
jgi:hypothetical protein